MSDAARAQWPDVVWERLTTVERERDELRRELRDAKDATRTATTALQQANRDLQAERERNEAFRRRIRKLEHERAVLRNRVAMTKWKLNSVRARKYWRIGVAVRDALRNPRLLLKLPVTLFRIVFTSSDLPPRPELEPEPGYDGSSGERQAARSRSVVSGGSDRTSTRDRLTAGNEALEGGDYEDALAAAESVLAHDPGNLAALDLKRKAHAKLGSLTGALEAVQQYLAVKRTPRLEVLERQLAGRLRELDTRWLPEPVGSPTHLEPDSDRRILHIVKESSPYLTNGYTMRNRYTYAAQRDAGLDPVVMTSLGYPRKVGSEDFDRVEDVEGVRHHRLDLGPHYPYDDAALDTQLQDTVWLAQRIVEDERPAIIHAGSGYRGYETALVGLALSRHYRIPFVYEVRSFLEHTWTPDLDISESGELYHLRSAAEVRCMRAADQVITIAHAMRRDLIDRGVPPERIAIVPNGVDPDKFSPRSKDRALVRELGLHGKTVIGYISNLGRREGIDLLVRATAKLVERGSDVVCLLVGDGPERQDVERLIADLGIRDHVRLTGRVPHDRIPEYYALIDVFVIPRRDDRAARLVTPLKPFEAMAMARPLLVSDLPALVELAAPGERGLAFRSEDVDSLVESASTLIARPELRERLGENGRRWVVEERDWSLNGQRYDELYGELLRMHAGTAGSVTA